MELSRRDVLKLGVLGSASLLLPIERMARTKGAAAGRLDPKVLATFKYKQALPVAEPMKPTLRFADYDFYVIEQLKKPANVLNNGKLTDIWGYNGITPGPNIHVEQGQRTIVRHLNGFKGKLHPTLKYEPVTSSHLHGSASLPEYDGYASDVTPPDFYKDYHYPNIQDARTLWYHDHGVHETASNAYMGLAAQYHLHDAWERSLDIPTGPNNPYDVGLTIRDAIFGADGQLVYDDNSESSVMGDVILMQRQAVADDAGRAAQVPLPDPQRLRLALLPLRAHQADNVYKADLPMTVIATDGGLMPKPQTVDELPPRHGRALRDHHRLREVPGQEALPQEPEQPEQRRLRLHQGRHAVRRPERGADEPGEELRSRRCSTRTRT